MSNVETRKVWEGDHVRVEQEFGGKPLARPIYFKYGVSGWYLSCEQAEALAAELSAAAVAARKVVQP